MRGIQIVLLFLIWNQIFSEEHNDDDVVIDDDDSEKVNETKEEKSVCLRSPAKSLVALAVLFSSEVYQ